MVLIVIVKMPARYQYYRVWSCAQKMGETGVCAEVTAILTAGGEGRASVVQLLLLHGRARAQ
jgi:hypothetical protein